jgi:hypothetical protein
MDDGQELNYVYQNYTRDSIQKLVAILAHTLAQALYCFMNRTEQCDIPEVPDTDTYSQLVSLCGLITQYCIGLIVVFRISFSCGG